MNRKTKPSLVSSTPHLKKNSKLSSIFDNEEVVSPINGPKVIKVKGVTKPAQSTLSKPAKSSTEINAVTSKKRKCVPNKEKESASSAALREMGVKAGASSTNVFSFSRQNMYNMYPQPILLDSDEEADFQLTNVKSSTEKNDCVISQPFATSSRVKEVNRKGRLHINPDEGKNIKQSKTKTKEESGMIIHHQETPRPSRSRPRAAKKQPLTDLANNVSPSRKIHKAKDKQAVMAQETSPNVLILESEEDSMFSEYVLPVNLSGTRKNNYLKFSTLRDIVDKDAIKWTPRSKITKCRTNKKEDSDSDSELDNSESDGRNFKSINNGKTLPENVKENTNKRTTNVSVKNRKIQQKNNFSSELFSRFEDVVFKPSKRKGCIVATSLETGSLNFGYLELGEGKIFTAQQPNITYVLLEGQVKASFLGKTQMLSAGDILKIHEDSGYQFHSLGSGHSRFLYVKEKHT